MIASVEVLAVLVMAAIIVAAVSPVILVTLWVLDWKKGRLW